MNRKSPQPSDELLDKIEEIGDLKKECTLKYRSLATSYDLYVQSGHLPDGATQYMAGGDKLRPDLVFIREVDGTRTVHKYKPGEWELKVNKTLSLCRTLWQASEVPKGWAPEKIEAYYSEAHPNPELLAKTQKVWQEHYEELNAFWRAVGQHSGDVIQLFFDELEKEWPIEHLELQNELLDLEAITICMQKAYGLGYMLAKGWISWEEVIHFTLYIGDEMAAHVRSTYKRAESKNTAFGAALSRVATRGMDDALKTKD